MDENIIISGTPEQIAEIIMNKPEIGLKVFSECVKYVNYTYVEKEELHRIKQNLRFLSGSMSQIFTNYKRNGGDDVPDEFPEEL